MAHRKKDSQDPPSAALTPHPLVEKLVGDPASVPQLRALAGLLGRSDKDGSWRVYLTPDLSEYVEVRESDVVHVEQAVDSPLRGSFVWVKATAELKRTYVGTRGAQREYLKGPEDRTFFCALWVTCPVEAEEEPEPERTRWCAQEERVGHEPPRAEKLGIRQEEEERTPMCPP